MAMELLPLHNQLVADFPADDEQHHFVITHIVQYAQVTDAQFELGQRVRPESFDRSGSGRRLLDESSLDGCFQVPLFAGG
jgi:hypothetical protein